jgi:hypothetical protein
MSAFDGLLAGILLGVVMTVGVWVFVEADRRSIPPWPATVPRRIEATSPAAIQRSPEPPARPAPNTEPRISRQARAGRRVVAPAVRQPALTSAGIEERARPDAWAPSTADARRDAPVPERRPREGLPLTLSVGGGMEASFSSGLGGSAQWTVALLVEPLEHAGFELAYVGTHGSDTLTSSVDLLARGYPLRTSVARYYVLGGVGWRHAHSPLNVDAATFPLGMGVTYAYGVWRADLRTMLRLATHRDLHTIGATFQLGATF